MFPAEAKKRRERAEEEWKEYEEMRRAEREKEDEEIRELRERRERRRKEREEEEKRLAEQRAVEEQKKRAEDEERLRKKREEEQRKREERERKRAEFEEKSKQATRRNFVINKKSGSVETEVKKEEVTKSKEQLEAERKAILEQRIQPLQIDGLKGDALRAKAKELNELIMRLEGDKYDLEQRFTRQSYDMQELAERARQMNKGDPLAAKISGIPPKVAMYSEYERVKDHRTFGERKTVFAGPLFVERYERIEPQTTVVMTEDGFV
ncbi:unnamed protein product, partial [Dibothriocephalus latus]